MRKKDGEKPKGKDKSSMVAGADTKPLSDLTRHNSTNQSETGNGETVDRL